jgi:hypothetical protein
VQCSNEIQIDFSREKISNHVAHFINKKVEGGWIFRFEGEVRREVMDVHRMYFLGAMRDKRLLVSG